MNVLKESFVFARRYMPVWITVILLALLSDVCLNLLPQAPQLIIDRVINPALGETPVVNESNPFNFLLNGLAADDYTEIKSGLEFGDRVVSGGITASIQEGMRVTAVEG